jgi:two-component system, OmpR family, response regulator
VQAARIGICEDDADLRSVVCRALDRERFEVDAAASGHEAVERFSAHPPDVLVLDIGLPDADGRDVCQALRASGQHVPVLFLTALDAVHERISGFRAGGDDYVGKPFSLGEVLVRIEALLRRTRPEPQEVSGLMRTPTGEEKLTPTEFRLLAALAARPGAVVRRRAVVAAGWPDGAIVNENTIDSYIRRLRVKLEAVDSPVALTTVRGVGFVLQ